MRYRLLGKSGLRVAEMSLGTMTFGEDWGWGSTKDESKKVYDAYREAGGNFVDTANLYTNGKSESLLGEFMQGHRDSVVLATKYTNSAPGKDPNAGGNHRKNMFSAIEASLKRLKTDYVDLYYLHIWDQITPVEEVVRAFDDLVRQGKILHAGVSDCPAWWISRAVTLAQSCGQSPFIALQIEYSLIERTVERELIPMADALGLGVVAWSPLAGGVLTGKYHGPSDAQSKDARYNGEMMKPFMPEKERADRIIEGLKNVANEVNRGLAQVALAWLYARPSPVIPIIGSRKLPQLQDNLAAIDLKLSDAQVKILDNASAIELGFPHDFFNRSMVRTFVYGGMREFIDA
jgi:aryl-alcohol dehydrogenase-like predicted oxidoreductase